jgi:dienelactone hydrolase
MTIPPVMEDIGAMLAFVERQRSRAVGCHGYCMSGPYALAAAARYPDRVAAAASFYGNLPRCLRKCLHGDRRVAAPGQVRSGLPAGGSRIRTLRPT